MKTIIVAGPTASGKSALAAKIASAFNGAVVNAESMQVYQGMPILTAAPDGACLALAPHFLYGVLAPDEVCSVGRWLSMAAGAVSDIRLTGKIPVATGGAGFTCRRWSRGWLLFPRSLTKCATRLDVVWPITAMPRFTGSWRRLIR